MRKRTVRIISAVIALSVVLLYGGIFQTSTNKHSSVLNSRRPPLTSELTSPHFPTSRKLLGFGHNNDGSCKVDEEDNGDVDNANCSHPLHQNNSCQFVKDNCGDDVALIDYLAFIACDLPHVKVMK